MSAKSRTRVALLRGVNVGRAKRIAMADLRALVAGLGYGDVRTLLNSGNVVFRAPSAVRGDPAARIERALADDLGIASRVTVLDARALALVVEQNPLAGVVDPARLLVALWKDPDDRARLLALAREDWSPDRLAVGERAAYLGCTAGILESALATALGKRLGDAVTTRNWATVMKLHALAC